MFDRAKMVLTVVAIGLMFAGSALADWQVGDGHKMHFPQLPDPDGWDIDMTNFVLADDWQCTETGPVSDIHFWYSNAFETTSDPLPRPHFTGVNVSIHRDVPVGPDNPLGYSHPGVEEWSRSFSVTPDMVDGPWDGTQGWDVPLPTDEFYRVPDHFLYWQLNITDFVDPFIQEKDIIYWLDLEVTGVIGEGVGWKTSLDHFNDFAVYKTDTGGWAPIAVGEPQFQTDLAFVITPEPATLGLLLIGGLALLRRRRSI